jgi:hypothetical protein
VGLNPGEHTVAKLLKAQGYATMCIGKWHLGGEGFGPLQQGFDLNLGGDHRGQPPSYFAPYGLPQLPDGPRGEYLTDREGAEAAAFIRGHRDRPFFLQVAFHAVHTPLQAQAELVDKYRRKAATVGGAQTNAVYAAMLESLDAAVGQVLRALDDAGLADRTVVVFTSDNGGLVMGKTPPTSNAPLRSGKGSPYEGGIRVGPNTDGNVPAHAGMANGGFVGQETPVVFDYLLGRPCWVNNDIAVPAANAKSIAFGDLKTGYVTRQAAGLQMKRLDERFAELLQVAFFGFGRFDGKVQDSSAFKLYVNSAT